MTVYVDDMFKYPMGQYRYMKMSHMIADTEVELHQMADRIGLKRAWFQSGGSGPHYDVTITKRRLAIEAGARQITLRQCAFMCQQWRKTGKMGKPSDYK
ncbi:MAG: DUF4031 domain-containing protein [Anaerolineae bacterium]|nr:DUF4031 domain-containing protein [Anaerolineae bacterium]